MAAGNCLLQMSYREIFSNAIRRCFAAEKPAETPTPHVPFSTVFSIPYRENVRIRSFLDKEH